MDNVIIHWMHRQKGFNQLNFALVAEPEFRLSFQPIKKTNFSDVFRIKKNGIPFQTMQKDFASRDDVLLWMIDTQFSRRNLDAPDRILLAQKKAPILERLAREKQLKTLKQNSENRFIQMDKTENAVEEPKTIEPIPKPEPKEPPKPIHVRKKALVMSYRGLSFYRHIIPIQACKGIQGGINAMCGHFADAIKRLKTCNKREQKVQAYHIPNFPTQ